MGDEEAGLYRPLLVLLSCLCMVLPLAAATPLPVRPDRQQTEVLFLSFSDPDLPDIAALIEEAETQILEGQNTPTHFTLEYLEPSLLNADASRKKKMLSFLREKHQGQTFDLVIIIGEQTAAFAEQTRARLFPDAALLFYVASPADATKWLAPKSGGTGVIRKLNYLPTLQLALRQNPGTRRVIVVSGSSNFEKLEMKIAREQFHSYESDIEFQYWTDLKLAEMKSRLANVEPGSVILFLDFLADADGEHFVPSRILPTMARTANRPMYGTFSSFVGNGVVGGSVVDLRDVGRVLGRDGRRILNGEKPENIPVETGEFQRDVFDWRQLHRWVIPNDQLPAGSSVLYWEYSPWAIYRQRILALSAAVVIETLLIMLLLHSRARRQRAEGALHRREAELSEAQRLAQMGSWQWDPKTDALFWSDELYRLTGFDPKLPVPPFKQLSQFFTSESWERLTQTMEKALRTGETYELELEGRRADGTSLWVSLRGEAVRDAEGFVIQLRGTMQNITERKQIEERLRESQERLTAIVASAMDAIIAVNDEQRIVVFNAAAEKMFGCPAQDAIGSSVERFIPQRFRTANREHIHHFGETRATGRAMGNLGALWGLRNDGKEFPIETSISHVVAGEKGLFTVIVRDITERHRAEEAVRESEKRFRLMADSAPVLMWTAGPDKLCTDFNKEWLKYTGRTMQQELGEGWAQNVHPDDLQACLRTYMHSFDNRQSFAMEYRLRRHDGEYRWMFDRGVPRLLEDGSFAGYIGCCIDITDQREAKAAQAELGGRLLQAQEEERARIARELHDDINQRLALLANGLQELGHSSAERERPPHKKQLGELWQLASEIATDIQHLSHQLHPSKLHYLGLAAAVRDLCHEFSKQYKIEVECIVRDLSSDLDQSISLSLFRTVQESLHNVAKHSQAHHVKVELTGQSTAVQLRVSDDGVGFDSDHAKNGHGLGLVSMQERLRSVGGEFSIWSRPSLGTQVEGIVPTTAKHARSA